KYQLAKAATSIGANYEEAQGAFSKEDFKYKISICFREAKEANYWLRILKEVGISNNETLYDLIQESSELKNIFGSIMKKIHFRKDV
ncbi:MAG TPA: four helix bundle protein, partial [Candidatus Wolfebacteria bacterium]|nr:four helix bundle protein [Candidatus Wolfebacteria bacterium]